MIKKLVVACLIVPFVFGACSASAPETPAIHDGDAETELSAEDAIPPKFEPKEYAPVFPIEEQIAFIHSNLGRIQASGQYYSHVLVSDLDRNGRLEVIAGSTEGIMATSKNIIYEINESMDDFTKAEFGKIPVEGKFLSEPQLVPEVFYIGEEGENTPLTDIRGGNSERCTELDYTSHYSVTMLEYSDGSIDFSERHIMLDMVYSEGKLTLEPIYDAKYNYDGTIDIDYFGRNEPEDVEGEDSHAIIKEYYKTKYPGGKRDSVYLNWVPLPLAADDTGAGIAALSESFRLFDK